MATTKRPSGLEQALIGFFQGVNTGIPAGVQQGRQQEKLEAERLRKEAADATKFQAEQIKLNEKIFNFIQTNDRTSAINVFGAENVERIVPTQAETLADVDLAQAERAGKVTAGLATTEETGVTGIRIPTEVEIAQRKAERNPENVGKFRNAQDARQYSVSLRNYIGLKAKREKWDAAQAKAEAEKFIDISDPIAKAIAESIFQGFQVPIGEFDENDKRNIEFWKNDTERRGSIILEVPTPTANQTTIPTGRVTRIGEFDVEVIED